MKARPLPFSGPMIVALLEGRKTMTRRIMKPQPSLNWIPYSSGDVHKIIEGELDLDKIIGWGVSNYDGDEAYKCPYGKPGDLLWCKETIDATYGCDAFYRADEKRLVDSHSRGWDLWHKDKRKLPCKVISSRYMPKWASRITLEITDITIERLQDISEEDAVAEGIRCSQDSAKTAFRNLWESINGKSSWDSNLYVWTISFKVYKCNIDSFKGNT